MQPETTTGTTLEILAPYFPFGITVQFNGCPYKVAGWNDATLHLEEAYYSLIHFDAPIAECRPWLRSFADLCTPLADGTVPAVEVAKLLSNDWANEQAYAIRPKLSPTNTCIIVRAYEPAGYMDDADTEGGHIHLLDDWNFLILLADNSVVGLENTLEAYAYLRRHHFAVGLEPHQYIQKGL